MLLLLACTEPLPVPKPEGDTGCTATEWYRDADGDGFGDVARGSTQACSTAEGFVAASGDCDDTDAAAFPGATESCDDADQDCDGLVDEDAADARAWFADADGDGYGAGDPTSACDAPAGFVLSNADCDDTDAGVSPDAEETCGGGDEDCDGDTTDGLDGDPWFADVDKDGFGDPSVYTFACDAPNGYVGDDTDCDDTDGDISPDGVESCNAIDDDCDGAVDEGAADGAQDWYADTDGDGFGDPSVVLTLCDALAGYIADASDCDDGDAGISPAGVETCDGVDQDCDSALDDEAVDMATWYADTDGDGFGAADVSTYACDAPSGYIADATDCDDAAPDVSPAGLETCDDRDEDCDGTVDDDASDEPTWYADTDGDGYGDPSNPLSSCDAASGYVADATDCDDTSATIHPGADETCASSADDDCDGTADEDPIDGPTWYADADVDGRGDPTSVLVSCRRPTGYVAEGLDCDDADADAHLGAQETCDPGDEDCDGLVDESPVDCSNWYEDQDGDGYGGTASTCECSATAGFPAANSDDCDDGDATVHPGATEVMINGLDDDCSGDVDVAPLADVGWSVEGDGGRFGAALAAPGDVEGDGLPDLLVAAPDLSGAGAVYWFSAPADGDTPADATVFVGDSGDDAGTAIAAGDLDGDGTIDLVVGAPSHVDGSNTGIAWVLLDLAAGGRAFTDADTTVTASSDEALGTQAAVLGDLDGDGDLEWAVGAPDYEDSGAFGIFSGASGGTLADADWFVEGEDGQSRLIDHGLSGIGDADGDGLDDFAIGANTALADGAVYVFFGTPAASGRIGDAADSTVIGLRSANFGASIGGGFDCDGDGYDDMLVTESAGRTRYVHLFTEVEDASSPTNARTSWYAANGGGLGDVLAAGDFAGNGAVDIVVPEPDLGRIHILDDCSSGTHDVDDDRATLVGEAGSEVGAALAIVGDLDGDGLEDLFAGAPAAESETGAVWGVLGR